MSIRAELIRVALRCFFKDREDHKPDVATIRKNLDRTKYLFPSPPKGTTVARLTIGDVPAVRVTRPGSRAGCHVLYLHGGGYCYGSILLYRDFVWRIAEAAEASVLCIDYRLAPEHPFPAAIEDATNAYRRLLSEGADPKHLAVMGDSAGGGLTFGSLLKLRDEGVPLPAAAVALSPWTDLTMTSDSSRRNLNSDPMLSVGPARILASWYLAGADLKTPYASPLHGDLTGLPPSLIQVGSDEILLDDAMHMAERLRAAGSSAEIEVWPRMPHVWQLYARIMPEAQQAVVRIGDFLRQKLS
jgi:acetyl esterase/lipase